MAESCLLYYITDRSAFSGDDRTRRLRLLDKIAEAATHNLDYIQLREKDLSARELELLANEAIRVIRECSKGVSGNRRRSILVINSRTDVALAVSAGGVHLPSDDVTPQDVRTAWESSRRRGLREVVSVPLVTVACHSQQEVARAAANSASFAIFGPVFEKKGAPGTHPAGLESLARVCRRKIPVLALGGITLDNAESCLRAGASGIAAIRLFQENDIGAISQVLRSL
jgi:thiamine-phosphate pyrophosphorylase